MRRMQARRARRSEPDWQTRPTTDGSTQSKPLRMTTLPKTKNFDDIWVKNKIMSVTSARLPVQGHQGHWGNTD